MKDEKVELTAPKTKDQAVISPIGFGGFNNKEIAILKATSFSKCTTPEEVALACSLAKKYDLDPFAQEIWAMNMKGKMIIQASASGWRKLIKKTSLFEEGSLIVNAVFPGDEIKIDFISGDVKHSSSLEKIEKKADPIGAYCLATINGKKVVKYVRWEEYVKTDQYSPWGKQKSEMICAKASAVFGRTYCNVSGLYAEGEVSEDDVKKESSEKKLSPQERFAAKQEQVKKMKEKEEVVEGEVIKTKK